MNRNETIRQLVLYQMKFPEEAQTVRRFIEFMEGNPRCFEKDLDIGHVTGSAWVVNSTGSEVLLTHHKKLNRWLQLGGHADGNSNVAEVALREAIEESGLVDLVPLWEGIFDADIHLIPARVMTKEHFHYDLRFVFRVTGTHEYIISDESNDLKWVRIDDISSLTDEESMLRMAEKWLSLMEKRQIW